MQDLNRLNDIFFKWLLGDDRRKNLTLDFLNDILKRDSSNRFVDIEFKDKELTPVIEGSKLSILDIKAKMNDNTLVNIEVQVAKQDFIDKRSLYYWSRIYSKQLKKGEKYDLLNQTITINLLNFNYFTQYNTVHNSYHVRNDKTNDILTNDLEMHFIELPKFKVSDIKKLRKDEKWIAYFSHNCTNEQREEIAMSEPVIKEALQCENYFAQDNKLRRLYDLQEKALRDYNSSIASAERRAEKRGEDKKAIQGAINLLKANIDINIIANSLGLSVEKVNMLKKNLDVDIRG